MNIEKINNTELKKQDYIMLILNCKKYKNKALYQKICWLNKIPKYLMYFHVIGDINLENEYMFDIDNQILYVKTPDDYNSLPKKVIHAYNAINKTFDFKYIFKTDDDQLLVDTNYFNVVKKILDQSNNIYHYGGFVLDIKQEHISQYFKFHPELPKNILIRRTKYCSGRFYLLSNTAIKNLLNKMDYISKEYLEDYAIGFYLDPSFKETILNIKTNKFFTDIELSDFAQWEKNLYKNM